MEKPKKVKIPAKGRKTGAQRDLERIRSLENAVGVWKLNCEKAQFDATAWRADFLAMSDAHKKVKEEAESANQSLRLEVSSLNEINDSLNAQLLQIVRQNGREPATSQSLTSSSPLKTQESVGESEQHASALDSQEGGDHYKKLGHYQPWEVLSKWMKPDELKGFMKGTVIAYLAREEDKGGRLDIKKAMHTIQLYLELTEDLDSGPA